ncbi:MAG TPA: DNA repair protein RecO [Candidatus Saccharimonadales bacterium]|nr:DNA repair protein RecO [Candidatus Saccharimonadales bacterium]
MNQIVTKGIVLARVNFGEADRIVTMLTPDHGKIRLMAKGVRRIKSKLAGGIELYSVSDITYIKGRGDIDTLVSSRLQKHFSNIAKDIDRTMAGYEMIKRLDKATEESPESEYYDLLEKAFEALDDSTVSLDVIWLWFTMQLLRFDGHAPNLKTDDAGQKLDVSNAYQFNHDHMAFAAHENGKFDADHIKFLRLGFAGTQAKILQMVQGSGELTSAVLPLVNDMASAYIRN